MYLDKGIVLENENLIPPKPKAEAEAAMSIA